MFVPQATTGISDIRNDPVLSLFLILRKMCQ